MKKRKPNDEEKIHKNTQENTHAGVATHQSNGHPISTFSKEPKVVIHATASGHSYHSLVSVRAYPHNRRRAAAVLAIITATRTTAAASAVNNRCCQHGRGGGGEQRGSRVDRHGCRCTC